jgi:thiol-disulfide isomerase/thioredoxin
VIYRLAVSLRFLVIGCCLLLGAALVAWADNAEVRVGEPAPVFAGEDLQGSPFDLSDFIGKYVVVLDFWSIYCSTCVEEIPHLLSLQEKFGLEDVVVIGVNMDAYGVPRVHRFMKGFEPAITYPVVMESLKREISQSYQVSLLPTTIVIAKDGVIRMKKVGFKKGDQKELFELVSGLLALEETPEQAD